MTIDSGGRADLRKPGQYGREVVRRHAWRWLAALVFLIAAQLPGLVVGVHGAVPAIAEVALIALMLAGDRKINESLDRRVRGAKGEEKVGAILDGLASAGWLTVHDASTGRGNIDHIAIGPGGVLTIETKSHRGRISAARVNQRWLAQAYAERKSLEELVGVGVDCLDSRGTVSIRSRRSRRVLSAGSRRVCGASHGEARVRRPPEIP